jgi:glycosyltransferase involved in cell wall biosynthesis
MQQRVKGQIFISNVTKAMEHEWFVDFTDQKKLNLEFILFNSQDSALFDYITKRGFKCRNYTLRSKLQMPVFVIYFFIELLFKRPHFVHCHLFEASLIGLLAAKLAGIKKRISTRHHSDFHHLYHPHAVKYDRWVNTWSTHIIAVSSNVANILKQREQVVDQKITIIPHGVPNALMDEAVPEDQILAVKQRYHYGAHQPVIGVVSRFVEWKGIQFIIPAFAKLLQNYPNALLVLANAGGNYTNRIDAALSQLPATSYCKIPFENDGRALFKSFDMFVHVPTNAQFEAFGQVYMEALFLKVPMVCTLSGIATELVKHNHNALVCPYSDSESIYSHLIQLLGSAELRERLTSAGAKDVRVLSFEKKYQQIISLYCN